MTSASDVAVVAAAMAGSRWWGTTRSSRAATRSARLIVVMVVSVGILEKRGRACGSLNVDHVSSTHPPRQPRPRRHRSSTTPDQRPSPLITTDSLLLPHPTHTNTCWGYTPFRILLPPFQTTTSLPPHLPRIPVSPSRRLLPFPNQTTYLAGF